MIANIFIKPIVWFDVEEAMLWYEQENKGLGKRFYNGFESTIEKIRRNPTA